MRVHGKVGTARVVVAWDISTGDPVVPLPTTVSIPRVLGEPIEMLGYAPETSIAEKCITILERGITSTRWRDYVDIVALARQGIDPTCFWTRRELSRDTARSLFVPSRVQSLGMVRPHRPSGRHGAVRKPSRTCASRTWMTRCSRSSPSWTPCFPGGQELRVGQWRDRAALPEPSILLLLLLRRDGAARRHRLQPNAAAVATL